MKEIPSPNFDARDRAPDMLLLHYTGMPTAEESLARMHDPAAKVSAHYFVDEDGSVISLVAEQSRAWHAGVAFWRGESDINSCSIGIEIQNPGHEFGYRAFPDVQIDSVIQLCKDILSRHDIPANRVLGHSDVAPGRKKDPGELFPWQRLAGEGIGLWPQGINPSSEGEVDIPELQKTLAGFGYDIKLTGENDVQTKRVVMAFQRHWQQEKIDGIADAGTAAILQALS